ncbi:L-aspartate oxidase [Jonesiaceae bacterium BS-20]|uniref:L-aspartate oxidase n=1 Tax=Jonesiaceae bacterium BS-20 TaxID=3120821 RepID=A0AAU7DYE9_9MICO
MPQPFANLTLPTALAAPEPGWVTRADAIVVGSGIAGLTAALELRQKVSRVLLVTKDKLSSGSTVWAQGGIAAALDPKDSPDAHLADTLTAGVGLCDPEAVRVLVTEGPQRVRELVDRGTIFDTDASGNMALTREGGHHANRIAHAGGDATGAEISRALVAQLDLVRADPGIEIIEHAQVLDVLTSEQATGRVACGVNLHVRGEGERDGVGAALARVVVLATGGIGQLYVSSTNPAAATADGAAAALRAGADLGDLEFVQFHPTVLWLGSGARGQLTLISEAVRGEGAYLIDVNGHRFMPSVHPMAELAPRDVVAHAIIRQMEKTGSDHVFLDARHLGAAFLRERFPTIHTRLAEQGFDLTAEPIPVAPAQHYHSGGIITDLVGRSTLDGLYAIGEAACTGVHGANRLASNSLLEGIVFACRAAEDIAARISVGELPQQEPQARPGSSGLTMAASRSRIQHAMTWGAGVLRSAQSLGQAQETLAGVRTDANIAEEVDGDGFTLPQAAEWETSNVHQVACALVAAATLRTESRGGHFRTDFPQTDPVWQRRIAVRLNFLGELETTVIPIVPQ